MYLQEKDFEKHQAIKAMLEVGVKDYDSPRTRTESYNSNRVSLCTVNIIRYEDDQTLSTSIAVVKKISRGQCFARWLALFMQNWEDNLESIIVFHMYFLYIASGRAANHIKEQIML